MGEMLDYMYYNMYNTCFVVVVCVLNGIFFESTEERQRINNGRSEKPKNTFHLRKLN